MSAFIGIFSTTDRRSHSMQSGSKPWTGLRSTFGEIDDECSVLL